MRLFYVKSRCKDENTEIFLKNIIEYGYAPDICTTLEGFMEKYDGVEYGDRVVVEACCIEENESLATFEDMFMREAQNVIVVISQSVKYSQKTMKRLQDSGFTIVDASISEVALMSIFSGLNRFEILDERLTNKKMEKSKNEDLFQRIIDMLPDPVWMKDTKGLYITCNKRFEKLFGATKKEIIGKTDYDFVSEEIADMFRAHDALAIKKKEPHYNEETLRFASDGHVEVLETIKTIIYDGDNNPYGVLGIGRDITLRKQAEESMKEINHYLERMVGERTQKLKITTERLSLATRAANIGTWDWDIEKRTMWWDPIQYSLYGLEAVTEIRGEEFIRKWQSMIYPEDYDLMLNGISLASGYKDEGEESFRVIRNDGKIRYHKILFTVFRDEEGFAYRFVGMCADITDEIAYNSKLKAAKELAEQANDAKTRFLANMSHEIRTPINAIIGMNYLMSKTNLDDRQADYIRKIKLSSEQLLGIVTDILDFSKIEAGKIKLEKIVFNLENSISTIYAMNRDEALKKGLAFKIEYDEAIQYALMGDPLRIEQVLNNLVNNAIKFTKEGTVVLQVKMNSCEEDFMSIKFAVTDTGIGLTEEQKNQLFQAFHQADSSTTRNYGGTGLGLIICQDLVNLMGGEIKVYDHSEQGSVFSFDLSFPTNRHIQEECEQEEEIPMLRDELSILVVEDNELNQMLTQQILEEHGADVQVAENGKEAVKCIEEGLAVDLILMDLQMPVMDGREAARAIHKIHGYERTPIIALTADAEKGIKEKLMKDGMVDYIAKPVHIGKMIETIKRWE